MIRFVLASAIPVAVGVAAVFLVGPSTFGVPRGEPILVAGGEPFATLHPVGLPGCDSTPLVGKAVDAHRGRPSSIRIIKLGRSPAELAISVTDLPVDGAPGGMIVLVLDSDGRLIAASDESTLPEPPPSDSSSECRTEPRSPAVPGII